MNASTHEITLPLNAADVATMQREAEAEIAEWVDFTIDTPGEYAAVDAALTDLVNRKDCVIAMRAQALGPLEQLAKVIRSWFAPVLFALERTEARYKGVMGKYALQRDAAEKAAREAAAQAAEAGESVVEHLTAATALAEKTGRATTRIVWKFDRVLDPGLVPGEYWVIDEKRLAAVARSWSGDDPPIVPGVAFKKDVIVGARR